MEKIMFGAKGVFTPTLLEIPEGLSEDARLEAIRDAANANPYIGSMVEEYLGKSGKVSTLYKKSATGAYDGNFTYTIETKARTQKASGLQAIKGIVPPFQVYPIERVDPYELIGKFVRPCPLTPRHGFVDSRYIDSVDEAKAIIAETLAADPQAEIVTMNLIDGPYSAVWNPGTLTVGPSHDGATQGHNALRIPTLGDYPGISAKTMQAAGITEAPYVEIVWDGGGLYSEYGLPRVVQLRNGPALPTTVNFIPRKMTVRSVLEAEGELLEWEQRIKSAAPGTVVWHPSGSLASHYAVHAVVASIPVIIDHEPKVGDVLEPDTKVYPVNANEMRAGFYLALTEQYSQNMEKTSQENMARLMLVATHNLSQWKGQYDFFIGLGMGAAFRLAATASIGEARHANRKKATRETVYSANWNSIASRRTKLTKALQKFFDPDTPWPGNNYGGRKWFDFMLIGVKLFNAVKAGKTNDAMSELNNLAHAAHNSGWAFDKFLLSEEMTQAANNPMTAMLRIGPTLYAFAAKYGHAERIDAALKMTKQRSISMNPSIPKKKAVEGEWKVQLLDAMKGEWNDSTLKADKDQIEMLYEALKPLDIKKEEVRSVA